MMFNPFFQHWGIVAERFVLFLTDVSIKSLILIAVAGLLALALRRASAAHRHIVWLLTLTAMLCLPFFSAIMPSREVRAVSHAVHVEAKPLPASDMNLPRSSPAPPLTAVVNGRPVPAAVTQDKVTSASQARSSRAVYAFNKWILAYVSAMASLIVFILWLLGATILLIRIGLALLRLNALRRNLEPLASGPMTTTITQVISMVGVKRVITFLQASKGSEITVPLTWGFLRPVVVIPPDADGWPEERLHAALLHETAHVKRGDWLAQMLGSLACGLYWFNPLVWAAARVMQRESERAADDYALTHGLRASDYASHLMEIAQAVQGRRIPRQATAMVRHSKFEHRLQAILGHNSRQQIAGRTRVAAIAAASCLLLTASAFRFSSRVEGVPAAPSTQLSETSRNIIVANPTTHQATLPNGVTVRLVGLADTQVKGPTHWWTADGSPVTEPLPKNTLVFPSLPEGVVGRAFAVSTTYDVAAQPKSTWIAPPNFAGSYSSGENDHSLYFVKPNSSYDFEPDEHLAFLGHFQEQETRRGSQRILLEVNAQSSRVSQKTVTLKYAVAAGPWTESVTCKKTPGKVYIKTPSGEVIFTLVTNPHHLPAAQAAHSNARFMVSDHFHSPRPSVTVTPSQQGMQEAMEAGENLDRTVLGLDSAGRVLVDLRGGMMTLDDGLQEDYRSIRTMQFTSIPNSLLSRIASFRLLARPFQWVEFKDVQLHRQVSAASATNTALAQADAASHITRGLQLEEQGQPRDGIPEYREAVRIDSNNAQAQFLLANGLYQINDKRVGHTTNSYEAPPAVLDEAILHMRKAVALQPADADWQSTLGTYLDNRGLYAQAIPFYRNALHLLGPAPTGSWNPLHRTSADGSGKAGDVSDNHWLLADTLLKTNQYQEAVYHYQEALRFNPNANSVLLGYGDALHGTKRYAEAHRVWEKIIAQGSPSDYYVQQARERLAKYRLDKLQ